MKLSPYQKYKDLGVEWLGEIPEHWDKRKVKYLFKERVEKGHPDQPLLAATQVKGVILKSLYENRTVLAQKDLHLLKLVKIDRSFYRAKPRYKLYWTKCGGNVRTNNTPFIRETA